jgi:hypothetical protein
MIASRPTNLDTRNPTSRRGQSLISLVNFSHRRLVPPLTNMSSIPVYIGRWQDYSRNRVLDDTITLDVR